ncbi:Regulator of G-protein signaling 7 [Orchesella cincta]|uniref:Regulator of G-protein signaling 7 n=1 Tax=Orchesella cincta TaxID=48709 RepID=A0A1D2MJL9_ORCCI|nr:Regulator of G-protein signaling 7 [Orchesella cincta]
MRVHTGETPYSCHICQQPFKHSGSLRTHVKNVHENPSKRPRPSKPRFMFKNSWPCNVCDRVFKLPSRLTKHMTLHTGEKEFECDKCGNRFRTAQCLQTHLKRHKLKEKKEKPFKCRYCGKFFVMFNELNNHRVQKHRNIPIPENREVEKTFGCGICGKPYYTKNQAMICAILRHDPTSLLEAMFKHKCPECPEERFGHRNLITLRKHWQEEHSHKTLPAEFRKGLYQDVQDSLPNVKLDKEKARDIRENGTTVKYEYPLYVEFELLDVEEQFLKKPKKKNPITRKHATCECTVCGFTLLRHNLKRHMQLHTNPKGQRRAAYVCGICNRHFRKIKTLRQHEKVCQTSGLPKRRPGRPKRSPSFSSSSPRWKNFKNHFIRVTFKEASRRHEVNLSESEDYDGANTTPYFWPSNSWDPENSDYAVYLCKRTMQNKTRLELVDYEAENLARLQKMFSRKWEFIFMQAEAQSKVDKKRDKLERKVLDSQERAFWDVHRPSNTTHSSPLQNRQTRGCQTALISGIRKEQHIPARRVRRWGFSVEELLKDPVGREHFVKFLEKEFSAENLKFWEAVQELKRLPMSEVPKRAEEIWQEFLAPDATCLVNVDSHSYEQTRKNIQEGNPDRWSFDTALAHVYHLMKSDSYSRYIRSEMYKDFLSGAKKKFCCIKFNSSLSSSQNQKL